MIHDQEEVIHPCFHRFKSVSFCVHPWTGKAFIHRLTRISTNGIGVFLCPSVDGKAFIHRLTRIFTNGIGVFLCPSVDGKAFIHRLTRIFTDGIGVFLCPSEDGKIIYPPSRTDFHRWHRCLSVSIRGRKNHLSTDSHGFPQTASVSFCVHPWTGKSMISADYLLKPVIDMLIICSTDETLKSQPWLPEIDEQSFRHLRRFKII